VISGGDGATSVEGYDLINFGSAAAEGDTYSAIGFGFRSRLHDRVDLGLSYENGVGSNEGIMDERCIVDIVIRFQHLFFNCKSLQKTGGNSFPPVFIC
jgi:hypothetical protein